MNIKRTFSIIFSVVVLTLIMLKFQNCAAPNLDADTQFSQANQGPGFVDDLVNKQIAFVENLIIVKHDVETINFDGLCDQDSNGKPVGWVIEDMNTRDEIQEGESECIRGGFRVTNEQMTNLECNKDYDLIAYVERAEDRVMIRKKCEPLSFVEVKLEEESTVASDLKSFQKTKSSEAGHLDLKNRFNKQCFYELDYISNGPNTACHKSCYMSGKLYSRESVEKVKCSDKI